MTRLDRAELVQHFRKHGARGTYLAAVCDHEVGGERVKLTYTMPKYTLKYALENAAEMRATLQLSLATSEDEVRRAMEHPLTGSYDVCRHERLRQRYVSV